MQELTIDDPIVEWAIEYAQSIDVFEKYGIDYCCGGKSLAYTCQQRVVDPLMVLREINEAVAASGASK